MKKSSKIANTRHISLKIPEELYLKLKINGEEQSRSLAQIIRMALKEWVGE